MGIFDAIDDFFGGKRYDHLDQEQTEAFIDALIFTIVADDEIATGEEKKLAEELEEFQWEGSTPVDQYTRQKREELRDVVDDKESARAFCEDIAERLDDDKLQEEAYYFAARVTFADRELLDEERVALNHLVEAFEIDDERLEMMTQELVREFGH